MLCCAVLSAARLLTPTRATAVIYHAVRAVVHVLIPFHQQEVESVIARLCVSCLDPKSGLWLNVC